MARFMAYLLLLIRLKNIGIPSFKKTRRIIFVDHER